MENALYKFIPVFYFPQVTWLIPDISRLLSHLVHLEGGGGKERVQNPKIWGSRFDSSQDLEFFLVYPALRLDEKTSCTISLLSSQFTMIVLIPLTIKMLFVIIQF